jgi:nucleoside-diphosphate-sugar epimerase
MRSFALVTGATGLLGSHIAEQLSASGRRVRALVRPGGDTAFLRHLGADLVVGDLTDAGACARAVADVESVFHAAAKVGDWGTWGEFQTGCMDATDNLARAAITAGVDRFVHISSTSAYGHPAEGGPPIDETAPLGQNLWWTWDYYTRSKVETEQLLWRLVAEKGLCLSVIRPSWLYGERDRITVARLVTRIRQRGIPTIGPGDNPMSAIYAGDVARAAILAADDSASAGEAYNITDQGPITQRDYLDLWAQACGAKPTTRAVPYRVAYTASFVLEAFGRLRRRKRPPLITRYATWLMGRYLSYSTGKARTKLGWAPATGYRESIARTVDWYIESQRAPNRSAALARS